MLDVCAAIQEDLDKLEKWTDRALMKFKKGKDKYLHLAENNPIHQYMLVEGHLASRQGEKDLKVLVDTS